MKDLVMFILVNLFEFNGDLKVVHMYDNDYASIEFDSKDSRWQINISRKDLEEKKDGNIV